MDKENNNKLKQYKKKLTTKGRVDMSKGGRVKAAKGFSTATNNRKGLTNLNMKSQASMMSPSNNMSQQQMNPTAKKPVKSKKKPTQAQQSFKTKGPESLQSNGLTNLNTTGQASMMSPVGGDKKITGREQLERANGTTPISGNKLKSKSIPNSTKELGQLSIDQDNRDVPTNGLANLRTTQASSPVQTAQAFQQAPVEPKRPDVVQPTTQTSPYTQETNMEKRNTNNYDIRDGEERDPNKVPPGQRGPGGGTPPYTPPGGGTPPYTPPGGGTPPGETPLTDAQKQAVFESERGTRVIESGRTAEQLAAGEIPEGMIPTAEVEKISMEGTEADTVQLDPTQGVTATTLAQEAPEDVALAEAKKGVTPDQIKAVTINDVKLIGEDEAPEVTAAIGGLSNEAIPRIQKAGEVSPTEAAKVAQEEIDKALAPEVRGQVSPESLVQALDKRAAAVVAPVDDATVATRTAEIISEKQKTDILSNVTGEGVNLEDIPQFNVVGKRTAQVAEANTRIAQELGTAPSMDADERAAITSDGIAKGDAAQIGGVPTLQAASRQAVTGTARKTAAADMGAG